MMVMIILTNADCDNDGGGNDGDGGKGAADKDNDDGENTTMCRWSPRTSVIRSFLRPLGISVYKLGAQYCSPKINFRFQNSVHLLDVSVIHSASIDRVPLCVCLCVGG